MIIAIDTRYLNIQDASGYGKFLYGIVPLLAKAHPADEFYLLSDRPLSDKTFPGNIKSIVTGPATSNLLLLRWWYDIRIPAVLKKIKADVFVAGPETCSLSTLVPQCMVVNELNFLSCPLLFKKTAIYFLKARMKKAVKKASTIACASMKTRNRILEMYGGDTDKFHLVYRSAQMIATLNEPEKDELRLNLTGSKNFFLYHGTAGSNPLRLLKAFSVFKKRQKSDWKLVLACKLSPAFEKSLQTYRYRDDVLVKENIKDVVPGNLIGAAYAVIYTSVCVPLSDVLGPMKTGTPVIAANDTAIAEIAGEAALYFDPADYHDMADKMMVLYKDENLRQQLIDRSKVIAEAFTLEKTASELWTAVRATAIQRPHR